MAARQRQGNFMRSNIAFDVVYTHTEGEPTCIIHSGICYPSTSSIVQKRQFIEENFDWVRRALMCEPRGHKDMFGVFVTPPSQPGFDAGLIWIDGTQYSHMCGHGTIAVSMAMVALGMVPKGEDGRTTIRLETTAGPVVSQVAHDDDRVAWCRFENVPAYVAAQDVPLFLPGLGPLSADIAWGGNYFAIIDIRNKGLEISPDNGARLAQIGVAAREMLRAKIKLQHPTQGHVCNFNFVTLWHEGRLPGASYKNVHVFSAGQLDRSPGGTGTSAMMAMLHARGKLPLNQPIQSEGLLGTGLFEGCLIGETMLGKQPAVRPTVKGKATSSARRVG
jgi:proline racemase